MDRRTFLIGAGPALVAAPAFAKAACMPEERAQLLPQSPPSLGAAPFDVEHLRGLRSAWEYFCWNADRLTEGARGWQILGAGRLEEGPFIQLVRVDLDPAHSSPGFPVERHLRIDL
ncbi:hypothetical protein ACO2RV_11615 [Ancylobacter sp. VNQ12]|uniref:hypothetical protein n=1 Tax=Ancylobacter sp. VNQ12 TaxID=3400920 RepID=UPI003C0DEE95